MTSEVSLQALSAKPYSAIGIIQTEWPDGTYSIGTFSIVGRNDLLTATHVVYDPGSGGWAVGFDFYLAADYNFVLDRFESDGTTLRYSDFTLLAYPELVFVDGDDETLTMEESQYDVAIIGLDRAVGEEFGWLRLTAGDEGAGEGAAFGAFAVGYPTDGTGMMQDTVNVRALGEANVYESDRASLKPGSSGGPLLKTADGGAASTSVIGVMSSRDALSSLWADLDATYDALLYEMAQNNALLGEVSRWEDPAYVVSDLLFQSQEDDLALTKTLAGYYAISTAQADQGDYLGDEALLLMRSNTKAWAPKTTLGVAHLAYDEQDYAYVLGFEKAGAKKTVYFEQAFDDQTGKSKGAAVKVLSPDWANSAPAAAQEIGLIGQHTPEPHALAAASDQ
jgi:V8-like Glu-specific endopeptidase